MCLQAVYSHTHPDGYQRGGVEGREEHGVTEHQKKADAERDLHETGDRRFQSQHSLRCGLRFPARPLALCL